MARKSEGLTPRQRQSQQIMRSKAAKKKRKELVRRLQIVGAAFLAITSSAGGLWLWKSGTAVRTTQRIVEGAYKITTDAGFAVQALYLDGRNRTSMADIEKAMDVKKGDPILRLSLGEVRERLEKIESVRSATVERALPGTLYVHIVEREPVAMWQHEGKIALVDDHGIVMNGLDIAPYKNLPLMVGDDAPQHIAELMALLAAEPELGKRFAAAVRVGERRWNIKLSSGIEVRLPEKDPAQAWKKLAELQARQQLLDRDIKVIDLRLPDRLFIRVAPEDMPGKTSNARET